MQAIIRAHKEWNVDIISISSGFHDGGLPLKQAIKEAAVAGIIIFASPSNYGNMRKIFFPARLHQHVLGIFATDARANIASSSASVNPQPDPESRNFAVLGEEITIHPFKEPVSGTSYSTAIAAAIAAQLLDFSRQPDMRQQIVKADELRSLEGMTAVLSLMTLGKGPHGYSCLRPNRLIEHHTDVNRDEKRRRICDKISDALAAL